MKPSLVAGTMQVMLLQSGGEELVHSISFVPRMEVERATTGMMSHVVTNELPLFTMTGGRVAGEEVEQAEVASGIMVFGTNSALVTWLKENKFICCKCKGKWREKIERAALREEKYSRLKFIHILCSYYL